MEIDFSTVEEANSFVAVPPGTYLCRIEEVRQRTSQDGSELWALRLIVAEGEHEGRMAAWDNLVWSSRAIGRVKRVLRMLGFAVEGRLRVEPRELEGRRIRVTVSPESYHDPVTGNTVIRNRVPFEGYHPAVREEEGEGDEAGEGCPF